MRDELINYANTCMVILKKWQTVGSRTACSTEVQSQERLFRFVYCRLLEVGDMDQYMFCMRGAATVPDKGLFRNVVTFDIRTLVAKCQQIHFTGS